ncbi:MAG TPA: flagellar biosynthesis anti-sigma factor FlgM [Clostridiales bacterium]|jgi:hypothetical protein|nr:flagellar biosynthesis anti-sigma factor FlgM [Clostridiales bacterium]
MEIRRIYTNYLHNPEKPVNKPGKPADDNFVGKIGAGADKIEISSNASFRSKLEEAKRAYVRKLGEDVSAQKLDELKAKYQGDNCPVPGELVAGAIMSRIFGPDENR